MLAAWQQKIIDINLKKRQERENQKSGERE